MVIMHKTCKVKKSEIESYLWEKGNYSHTGEPLCQVRNVCVVNGAIAHYGQFRRNRYEIIVPKHSIKPQRKFGEV